MKSICFYRTLRIIFIIALVLSYLCVVSSVSATPEPSQPVVHAVLFYSPTCGHCQYVITEVLPPLIEQYGEQLSIVGVDISMSGGQALFMAALQNFDLESGGVPFLVVGDTYLVGSVDIPEKFPDLIEQHLAQGGLDWPSIPGLVEALEIAQSAQAASPEANIQTPIPQASTQTAPTLASATQTPNLLAPTPTTVGLILTDDINLSVRERLALDPTGNGLAVGVLAGMILILIYGIIYFRGSSAPTSTHSWNWLFPVLCIAGLAIAGYLAYVEVNLVEAYCGPVGDCNSVQQSEYARLFGILPIGVLGVVGYILILLAWVVGRKTYKRPAAYASLAVLGMTSFGVLFSIYLTFLEPFVIGSTCAWCLTSAIIITTLFWLSLAPGKREYTFLFIGEKHAFKRRSSRGTF
jgi:uncharacterized membrane protein/thiol-disulfide isomerase/thioredoxin